ncbi:DUF5626 family protein [Bacillus sp. V33-4]|uniref:DUF5626 family protein n=1 Tax=Bacillus sp. V33-4 TaxID=2054169 RepID=UPI000C782CEF|nr:DUF5626 family protein [Bacillus sp. V33-4]PLR85174.1 hypothetical protein CVD23_09480 [Bacillus sp. V33-4]
MRNWKWFGFLIVVVSILVFGNGTTEAHAAEKPSKTTENTFDLSKKEVQEVSYVYENGENVTITVEPVPASISGNSSNLGDVSTLGWRPHYFPYGTTTGYKVSATTPYLGLSFYVNVYVPSNTSNSRFTKAYNANYWVIGATFTDREFTRTDKLVTYEGDFNVLGGFGGANAYLKAHLNNNLLTTSTRM